MNHRLRLVFALTGVLALAACQTVSDEGSETAPVGPPVLSDAAIREALHGPVRFQTHIRPLFQQNCLSCHDGRTMPAFVNLKSRASAFSPGPYGPRIVPGKPGKSLIIQNLSRTHAPVQSMPPVGNRMTPDEIRILKKWITEGAVWPED